jgi:hypothetical protein
VSVNKGLFVDVAIAAALLLVGAAGYYYSPLLLPKTDIAVTADAGCNLQQQACGAALPGGGRIELAITPRPIPNLQALAVEVRLAERQASHVVLDLAGATMNMGVNRTDLVDAGGGRYTGTTSLPVCVTGAMSWRATVLLESGRERISVPFYFDSSPH